MNARTTIAAFAAALATTLTGCDEPFEDTTGQTPTTASDFGLIARETGGLAPGGRWEPSPFGQCGYHVSGKQRSGC